MAPQPQQNNPSEIDMSKRPSQARPRSSGRVAPKTPTKRKRTVILDDSDSDGAAAAIEEFNTSTQNQEGSSREESRETSAAPAVPAFTPRKSALLQQGRERRKEIPRKVDEREFDNWIYSQEGASKPPPGVVVRQPMQRTNGHGASGPARGRGAQDEASQLFLRVDPRVHWNHNKSDEWYQRRMEEIRRRGGRKANFGKAASRMRARRREEALIQSVTSLGQSRNESGSEKFGRPIDFSDVPESELPDMVKSNPNWMKAVAWMRKCREKSIERQKEIERRKRQKRPWDDSPGPSGL